MNKVLLIGGQYMALEYLKILRHLEMDHCVVVNSTETAVKLKRFCECDVFSGGAENLDIEGLGITHVIVAVGVTELFHVTKTVVSAGVSKVLVEKPGALNDFEAEHIARSVSALGPKVFIGYNRRFYHSVAMAKKLAEEDSDILSCTFEFTEWSSQIADLQKDRMTKERWVVSNSSHVLDLFVYLCGFPSQISTYTSDTLDWHPASAIFSGAGLTERGVLFSYTANWKAPGRWGIELLTKNRRLILSPLEELKVISRHEPQMQNVKLKKSDPQFKDGLIEQVRAFLNDSYDERLVPVDVHARSLNLFAKIAGYQ